MDDMELMKTAHKELTLFSTKSIYDELAVIHTDVKTMEEPKQSLAAVQQGASFPSPGTVIYKSTSPYKEVMIRINEVSRLNEIYGNRSLDTAIEHAMEYCTKGKMANGKNTAKTARGQIKEINISIRAVDDFLRETRRSFGKKPDDLCTAAEQLRIQLLLDKAALYESAARQEGEEQSDETARQVSEQDRKKRQEDLDFQDINNEEAMKKMATEERERQEGRMKETQLQNSIKPGTYEEFKRENGAVNENAAGLESYEYVRNMQRLYDTNSKDYSTVKSDFENIWRRQAQKNSVPLKEDAEKTQLHNSKVRLYNLEMSMKGNTRIFSNSDEYNRVILVLQKYNAWLKQDAGQTDNYAGGADSIKEELKEVCAAYINAKTKNGKTRPFTQKGRDRLALVRAVMAQADAVRLELPVMDNGHEELNEEAAKWEAEETYTEFKAQETQSVLSEQEMQDEQQPVQEEAFEYEDEQETHENGEEQIMQKKRQEVENLTLQIKQYESAIEENTRVIAQNGMKPLAVTDDMQQEKREYTRALIRENDALINWKNLENGLNETILDKYRERIMEIQGSGQYTGDSYEEFIKRIDDETWELQKSVAAAKEEYIKRQYEVSGKEDEMRALSEEQAETLKAAAKKTLDMRNILTEIEPYIEEDAPEEYEEMLKAAAYFEIIRDYDFGEEDADAVSKMTEDLSKNMEMYQTACELFNTIHQEGGESE